MVNCPVCSEQMAIEEREITYVIGFNSVSSLTQIAVCPCGVEIAMVGVSFDGQTLEVENDGSAYGRD